MFSKEKEALNRLANSDQRKKIKSPEEAGQVICNHWPFVCKVLNLVMVFAEDKTIDLVIGGKGILCSEGK